MKDDDDDLVAQLRRGELMVTATADLNPELALGTVAAIEKAIALLRERDGRLRIAIRDGLSQAYKAGKRDEFTGEKAAAWIEAMVIQILATSEKEP